MSSIPTPHAAAPYPVPCLSTAIIKMEIINQRSAMIHVDLTGDDSKRSVQASLHQHLETARGTYVAITTLVNVPALEPGLLRNRVLALTRCAPGVDPAVALSAQAITGNDISDVAVTAMM